ncbi:MAG TPA: PIN domain-containing protein [Solirubrobacteraceae bacterium]
MSAERAFLDTNVLVYLFDHDEPDKEQCARDILEQAEPGELVLSTQVLSEFYVVVTRKLKQPLDAAQAAQAVDWLSLLGVVTLDPALVKAAIQTSRSSQLSYWDGLIVASAAAGGCERLLTEDLNDGQVIGSVRVENPFRERVD